MFKLRHPHQPSKLYGVRPDGAPWRRRETPIRRLTNKALVTALAWVHTRATDRKLGRREWSVNDQETTDEVEQRAWGFGELQNLPIWVVPSWFTVLELPRRAAGYERFLGMLLQAYRARAVGALLSYEECMSLTGVRSRSTWRAWCVELEAAGLVRIVQTWRQNERGKLEYSRLLYRIGPRFEEVAGPALCEGALVEGEGPSATWARRIGQGLRRRARAARRGEKAAQWQACRGEQGDDADRGEPAAEVVTSLADAVRAYVAEPASIAGSSAPAGELVPELPERLAEGLAEPRVDALEQLLELGEGEGAELLEDADPELGGEAVATATDDLGAQDEDQREQGIERQPLQGRHGGSGDSNHGDHRRTSAASSGARGSGSSASALQSGFAYGVPNTARQGARAERPAFGRPVSASPLRALPASPPAAPPDEPGAGDEGGSRASPALVSFLEGLAANEGADSKARRTAARELERATRRPPARCPACDGCGLTGGLGGDECSTCGGSGQVADLEATAPRRSTRCLACRGRGELGLPPFERPCTACGGRGRQRPAPASCSTCNGAGVDHHTGAECPACAGSGQSQPQ